MTVHSVTYYGTPGDASPASAHDHDAIEYAYDAPSIAEAIDFAGTMVERGFAVTIHPHRVGS